MIDDNLLRFKKDVKYTWIDVETFNLCLNFQQNRLWQAGLIEVIGTKIIQEYDIRINWPDAPELQIGAGAAMITHYNQYDQDKLAIDYKKAFPTIWDALKRADYICGHNLLNFDLYLIRGYAELMGEEWKWIVPKIIDTKAIAQGIKMQIPYNKDKESFIEYQYKMVNAKVKGIKTNLKLLAQEYGIPFEEERLHDGLYDLLINKQIWDRMIYQVEL